MGGDYLCEAQNKHKGVKINRVFHGKKVGYPYLEYLLLLFHVWQEVPHKVLECLLELTAKPQPLPNAPLIHFCSRADKAHHLPRGVDKREIERREKNAIIG